VSKSITNKMIIEYCLLGLVLLANAVASFPSLVNETSTNAVGLVFVNESSSDVSGLVQHGNKNVSAMVIFLFNLINNSYT
jgi:hypothetical protein